MKNFVVIQICGF